MNRIEIDGERLDATGVRAGNALWPGLACFTGITFLVYLSVKAASGATPVDAALAVQLAVSVALAALGGAVLARGRYFYAEIETADGRRRFKGLTKARQQEIVALAEGAMAQAPKSGSGSGA